MTINVSVVSNFFVKSKKLSKELHAVAIINVKIPRNDSITLIIEILPIILLKLLML